MIRQEPIKNFTGRSVKNSFKFWGLTAVWVSCLFFLLFQGGKLAYMVFFIMTLLYGYLMLGRWSGIVKAKGTRTILNVPEGREIQAGTGLQIEVKIEVPGIWPIPYVIMQDQLIRKNKVADVYELSLIPDWKRRGRVVYTTRPLRRGYYSFKELTCLTEDIFGFFKHEGTIKMNQSFVVVPKTVHIKAWDYFEQMQRGYHYQSHTTRNMRETTQINGVRDYTYGDKLTRIHWNATARTGDWKSKEFERESLPKTIFVLDRNLKSYMDADAFELAVSAAASLLKYGKEKATPQGLLSIGLERTYFEPYIGHSHLVKMMRHLTDVEADGNVSLSQIVKEHCSISGKGLFFVLITGQSGNEINELGKWLQSSGHQFCQLWINPGISRQNMTPYVTADGSKYPVPSLQDLPRVLEGRYR